MKSRIWPASSEETGPALATAQMDATERSFGGIRVVATRRTESAIVQLSNTARSNASQRRTGGVSRVAAEGWKA
jgi:hypothetical protein